MAGRAQAAISTAAFVRRRLMGVAPPEPTCALDDRPDDKIPDVPYVQRVAPRRRARFREFRTLPPRRSTEDWEARIKATASNGKVFVVDFTAPWCGPCQKIYPFYKRLAATFADRGDFVKVDVDDLDEVAESAKVSAMPTFQVYANGALAATITGANQSNLQQLIEQHCKPKDKKND